MKALISSDYHINEKRRLEDTVRNLDIIATASNKRRYSYYIVAGDVFDRKRPTVKELLVFAKHLSKVKADKIILIRGNHVKISKEFSALDLFDYDERVTVCDEHVIKIKNKKILITHEAISEAKVGVSNINLKGIKIRHASDYADYDFVICGHIHKFQILDFILIPGSINRIDFGEREEDKYYHILEVDLKGEIYSGSIKLPTRKMLKIIYDFNKDLRIINDKEEDPRNTMEIPRDAIVKLILRGSKEKIKKINYDKMMKFYEEAYSVDLILEYNMNLPNNSDTKTTCLVMNKENIIAQLKDYCKNNNLEEDVFKISKKIISNQ